MKRKRGFFFLTLAATAAILLGLNYFLWHLQADKKQRIEGLSAQIALHKQENLSLEERNQTLGAEVQTLRSPDSFYAYEEQAREEYGMIGRNETFFVLPETEIADLPDIVGLNNREGRKQLNSPPVKNDDGGAALHLESIP